MPFTDLEKTKIRLYLGYANLWRYKDTRLESCLDDGAMDDDALTVIRGILTNLATIDTAVFSSGSGSAGGARGALKRVDEIEFYDVKSGSIINASSLTPVQKGSLLINQLSLIFGVPFYGDYYGTGGYPGDSYSGPLGSGNGGSKMGGSFGLG